MSNPLWVAPHTVEELTALFLHLFSYQECGLAKLQISSVYFLLRQLKYAGFWHPPEICNLKVLLLLRATPLVLSMWPCKLKLHSLLRLVRGTAKQQAWMQVSKHEDSKRFLFIVLSFMLAGSCLHSCLTVDFVCFKISRRTCMMLHRQQLKLCKKLHQQRLLFAVWGKLNMTQHVVSMLSHVSTAFFLNSKWYISQLGGCNEACT